jgi:hypothetical protein
LASLFPRVFAKRRAAAPKKISIGSLGGTLGGVLKWLYGKAETLVFLANDIDGALCELIVSAEGVDGPKRMDKTIWDNRRFRAWQSKYPHGYGWEKSYGALGENERPLVADVEESVKRLNPISLCEASQVTVLPESDLFGFTFQLSNFVHSPEQTQPLFATAPSLTWLTAVRGKRTPVKMKVGAWLGHPKANAFEIQKIRGELDPIVKQAGGDVLNTATPESLKEHSLAIILAHGSRGQFGSFSGIDDEVKFTPRELGEWVGGASCVVLFVCNAGKSMSRSLNNETLGVIANLLRKEAKAVIAPPAPLSFLVPQLWLAPFLDSLSKGDSVANAHRVGLEVIRKNLEHPCAWNSLQLFGDCEFRFTV